VRYSPLCATAVAGVFSVLSLAAPAAAQAPAGAGRPAAAPAAAAPAAPSGTNVAVIDVAFIFKNHARFNAMMNDIKKDIEGFEAYVREEQKKFNTAREALANYTPSSQEYKKKEEELALTQSKLQVDIGMKRKEFLEQEARVYFNVYKEVEASVAMFAQRYRIGLVLRFNADEMKQDDRNSVLQGVNRAVVFQQGLDITEHILRDLNAGAATPGAQTPAGGTAIRPGPVVPGRPQLK
jgi:Skp family chaperone for outer membrane proteins